MEVVEHYEKLLAAHYAWMVGPFADKVAAEKARLQALGMGAGGGLAIDLGCGPGYQAFALAELGYRRILAVDTSERLLNELRMHLCAEPIEPIRHDMRRLDELVDGKASDCITCMGDTLTHLSSRDEVATLFKSMHAALAPGGALALSFRDLTQPRHGSDRFLLPRADRERILSCFLEYVDEQYVRIHDILHQREGDAWTLQVSDYLKLRLSSDWVVTQLRACGFTEVTAQTDHAGWTMVKAKRPL